MKAFLPRTVRRIFRLVDAAVNRLYGWRYNPLYQSGTIAVVLLVVLLVTGLYLLLFYRVGDPHASIVRITDQAWTGRWIRTLHRYASDAAIVAIAVHALRIFFQRRTWGARALAWVSGLVLLSVFFVAGWTGFVMVWDVHGRLIAIEGARLLDLFPVFSEPLARAFMGEEPVPGAFFFLNLFAHIALPIGLAALLWLHVSKVARPTLLPPRRLTLALVGLLGAISLLWPVGAGAPADPARLSETVPLDLFYGFWIPVARSLPSGLVMGGAVLLGALLLLVPVWTRPREERRPPPSVVDEGLCTGCEQCWEDCPYEAITMIEGGRTGWIANVDPALCVSCGICAGSCAPMGVGPPGRTGRDQLARVKAFLEDETADPRSVVVVACTRGAGGVARRERLDGCPVYAVDCAGNLHTSVVEYLIRGGWGGVAILACPPRDCWNREGPKWLEARLFHDREAELKERVDRRRVHLTFAAEGEREIAERAVARLRERAIELSAGVVAEEDPALETECEVETEEGTAVVEIEL